MNEHQEEEDITCYDLYRAISHDIPGWQVSRDVKDEVLVTLLIYGGDGEFWYPYETLVVIDEILTHKRVEERDLKYNGGSKEEFAIIGGVLKTFAWIRSKVQQMTKHYGQD